MFKKHNKINPGKKLIFLLGFSVSLLNFSCKSSPEIPEVNIFKLVDLTSVFTIYIPVQNNKEFVNSAFARFSGFDENSVQKVTNISDEILISLNKNQISGAVSGSFPSFAVKNVFSEKNGWNSRTFSDSVFPINYYSSSNMNMQVSLVQPTSFLFAEEITPLLKNYDFQLKNIYKNEQIENKEFYSAFVENYFLEKNEGEIRFFSTSGKDFAKLLLKKNIDLGIDHVKGKLLNSKAKNTFSLELEISLTNPQMIKAAAKLLKMALFPIPAKIEISGKKSIMISDISLTYNELLSLIGLS